MKKFIFLLMLANLIVHPAFSQTSIQFKPTERKQTLLINRNHPQVYKPSKLILGKSNKFIIKAEAGSYISLATSTSNEGAPLFYGHKLRLGNDITTYEGTIPANGILELEVKLPNDNSLDGKELFFEVAVWKNKDFSDLTIAKIISTGGTETQNNAIAISKPVESSFIPLFTPVIPGAPTEVIKTIEAIQDVKSGKVDYETYEEAEILNRPVIQRDLNRQNTNKK